MSKTFLKAEWLNLLMANYEIDPKILTPYLPCHTELDEFQGKTFVSLVGFLFKNVRVLGVKWPFHHTFEEVNLRFYVRYRDGHDWKRGVVFMKEIVPKRMVSFIANNLYGEKYATHRMKHLWSIEDSALKVSYEWMVNGTWNFLRASAEKDPEAIKPGSEEEFITEHYWGYTHVNEQCTGVYEVVHPKWQVHKVNQVEIFCDTARVYGSQFAEALSRSPSSVFLAKGSPIEVQGGSKLYK